MGRLGSMLGCPALVVSLWTAGALGGQPLFYHVDPAGSPLAMSDASGNVVWRADYRPFGEIQSESGTTENNKLFVGKEKDDETGLYYFGARYMDDRVGRFVSPDPIGAVDPRTGKINRMVLLNPQRQNYYAYALNNPYSYIDATGEAAVAIALRQMFIVGHAVIAGEGVAGATGAITGAFIGGTLGQLVIDALKEDSQGSEEGKNKGEQASQGHKGEYVPRDADGNPVPLPTDAHGNPVPLSDALHTEIGWRDKEGGYRQTREFGAGGKEVKRTDWTDHGRRDHPSPHDHRRLPNPTGGTPRVGPHEPMRVP